MTATANSTKPCVSSVRFVREAPDLMIRLIKDRDDYPERTKAQIARSIYEDEDELGDFEQLVFDSLYKGTSEQKMQKIIDELNDDFIDLLVEIAKIHA